MAAKKKKAKKKVTKKKATTKKRVVKKKVSSKKTAKKKLSKKKTAKKASKKKVTKKKTKSAKKSSAKKSSNKKASKNTKRMIAPYVEKKGEEYMSQEQLEHFREILLNWKRQLIEEADKTVHHMQEEAASFADPSDRATQEEEFGLELRTRDRERKLLRKINSALSRIDDGSYGYCEDTGEEIGVRRLEARPVATLCLEAQQRREMAKRQYRDSAEIDR